VWDGNAVHWRGRPSYQLPHDLLRYQEIIVERRPDWVIETGAGGGTTAFLRDVCGLVNHGFVVAVEKDSLARIPSLRGTVMAILDSDVYSQEHMAAEIAAYAPLVTTGHMLVVCHTDRPDWGAAPALTDFLANNSSMFREEQAPPLTLCTYLERT
jgi:cephalosporin hydroxylase